mmetsp:Transcript_6005/g.9349  ORF Transcript_6005/g.9349 Transcript_6005/m.9349 type:complete len:630 (-) Transcript_6005:129-2018(-)
MSARHRPRLRQLPLKLALVPKPKSKPRKYQPTPVKFQTGSDAEIEEIEESPQICRRIRSPSKFDLSDVKEEINAFGDLDELDDDDDLQSWRGTNINSNSFGPSKGENLRLPESPGFQWKPPMPNFDDFENRAPRNLQNKQNKPPQLTRRKKSSSVILAKETPPAPKPVARAKKLMSRSGSNDSSIFKLPSQPLSQRMSQHGKFSRGFSAKALESKLIQEKRSYCEMEFSQGDAYGLGSQDFCTPQDQEIKQKSEFQLAETLQISRMPAKKAKTVCEGSSSSSGGDGKFQLAVTNYNGMLPEDIRLKRRSPPVYSTARSLFLETFERTESIGSGAFGEVILCRHRLDGCIYAVKKIRKMVVGELQKKQVLNEVFAMSALNAYGELPNSIVRYYNSWLEDDRVFIQFEYCRRGSLNSKIKKGMAFNEAKLLKILLQISKALVFLHDTAKIAHLDIKPDNILENHEEEYKICDFGLATQILPIDGQPLPCEGDRHYLPPEALSEATMKLDKVDIFSLGITLYELAQGKPLISDKVRYNQLRSGHVAVLPGKSSEFHNLIRKMVSPNAAERPRASDIVEYLQNRLFSDKHTKMKAKFSEEQARMKKKMDDMSREIRRLKDQITCRGNGSFSGF